MSTMSASVVLCSSDFPAASRISRSTVSSRPAEWSTPVPSDSGRLIGYRCPSGSITSRGSARSLRFRAGTQGTGEAGGDDPRRAMAVDEEPGGAAGGGAAHAPDRDRHDLAVELSLDHGHRYGVILPDPPQAIHQVADFHRQGGHDADIGWDRRRRHHAPGAPFPNRPGRDRLDSLTGPKDQLICHLIIFSMSPSRLLTPTAAEVS